MSDDHDAEIQKIADEAAEKVADLSDVQEDVEVTITELPPGGEAPADAPNVIDGGAQPEPGTDNLHPGADDPVGDTPPIYPSVGPAMQESDA